MSDTCNRHLCFSPRSINQANLLHTPLYKQSDYQLYVLSRFHFMNTQSICHWQRLTDGHGQQGLPITEPSYLNVVCGLLWV